MNDFSPAADDERLAVLNAAFRDPATRTVAVVDDFGLHRIAHRLDLDAVRRDPKPVVGAGQTTHLHLSLWRELGLPGLYGAPTKPLTTTGPVTLQSSPDDISAQAGVEGRAAGILLGGNLNALTRSVGCLAPSLNGALLFLEDTRVVGLGVVDRALTQLLRSGVLRGVRGIALGRFTGFDEYADRGWTLPDVLRDRLGNLGVPVLGGLPIGPDATPIPVGTTATLDTASGTLRIAPATTGGGV